MARPRQTPDAEVGASSPSETGGRRIRGLDADGRRAQRRTQLIDAALELFAENGYLNTSIEQICQRAYVGTKAFYELFDGKESCYIALLRQVSERIEDRVVAALGAAPDLEADAVAMVVSTFAHALVDDPRLARVTFGEASGISPTVERQRRVNRRWAAGFIETLWRRYDAATNTEPSIDYRPLAIGTIGGLFELVADWLLETDTDDARTVDALIADLTGFTQTVRDGIRSRTR